MNDFEEGEEIEWGGRIAHIVEVRSRTVLFTLTTADGPVLLSSGEPEIFWSGKLEWALTRSGIDDGQRPFRNPQRRTEDERGT